MKKRKNGWVRFWGWFLVLDKEERPAKLILRAGILLSGFAAVLFFLDNFVLQGCDFDYINIGKAGIALLGVGGLLLRAVSSDKIAVAQHKTAAAQQETVKIQQKAEKNQRLAGAIKLMASMEKNARAGYLPDGKGDFKRKEVLHPDEIAQMGGIEILHQLMQEDQKYHELGINLLQNFIFRGANKLNYETKIQGGGYPLHEYLDYYRVGFNIQKALQVLGLEGEEGIYSDLSSLYLVGLDLSVAYFSDMDFIGSNMSDCNLGGAHFTDCSLTCANFTACNLESANFTNCDLREANFTDVYFFSVKNTSAKFKNADIDECNFTGAVIAKETLLKANFKVITAINGKKMSREKVEQFDKKEWDKIVAANLAKIS